VHRLPYRSVSADELRRAQTRIAHEIIERNHVARPRPDRLHLAVPDRATDSPMPSSRSKASRTRRSLDVAFYRATSAAATCSARATEVAGRYHGELFVLVDECCSRRTIRAAMDAVTELGDPAAINCVLIDPVTASCRSRGLRRQKPADGRREDVRVRLRETDDVDEGHHRGVGSTEERVNHLLSIEDLGPRPNRETPRRIEHMADVLSPRDPEGAGIAADIVIFLQRLTRTRLSFETRQAVWVRTP